MYLKLQQHGAACAQPSNTHKPPRDHAPSYLFALLHYLLFLFSPIDTILRQVRSFPGRFYFLIPSLLRIRSPCCVLLESTLSLHTSYMEMSFSSSVSTGRGTITYSSLLICSRPKPPARGHRHTPDTSLLSSFPFVLSGTWD